MRHISPHIAVCCILTCWVATYTVVPLVVVLLQTEFMNIWRKGVDDNNT